MTSRLTLGVLDDDTGSEFDDGPAGAALSGAGLAEDEPCDSSLSAGWFAVSACSASFACRWRRRLARVARVFAVRLSRAVAVAAAAAAGAGVSTPSAAAGVMALAGR